VKPLLKAGIVDSNQQLFVRYEEEFWLPAGDKKIIAETPKSINELLTA
jgi:hypothetical protein